MYVLSSGNAALDTMVTQALTSQEMIQVTLGPEPRNFTYIPAHIDVVYVQNNANYQNGPMHPAGDMALSYFVWDERGGIVTTEWFNYYCGAGWYPYSEKMMPVTNLGGVYATGPTVTFTVTTPDPTLTAGLPNSFEMNLTSYGGTESILNARPDATVFLESDTWPGSPAVAGWGYFGGRIVSFSTLNGPAQFESPEFVRLLGNTMHWADRFCYPDCNRDNFRNLADFGCFQTAFALGHPYADCNNDGLLNLSDFGCFQTKFALGCP